MSGWRKRTIMELAREAGMTGLESSELLENFEDFAKLVREECAYKAGIALLGADRGLANRVDHAIRNWKTYD
jgi:hypothetical protein